MADDRFVDGPPAGPEGWREVWEADRRYAPRGDNAVWSFLRRLFRRAIEPDAERQKNFNVTLLELLGDLRRDVGVIRDELRGDVTSLQNDMRVADEAIAADVAKVRELIPVAARRNDALIAALDQKIETLAVRLRDVTNPVVFGAPSAVATSSVASDFLYRRLEDNLRGSENEVRRDVQAYVERARGAQPVLDVGCGRGELLAACREAGIEARGFDTNERSVADLRARGFNVEVAGVPECFGTFANGSVGAVLVMHVVEHLPVEILFSLFREAARVLRPGGLLMIETPNAESLAVSASEFWRDPTHLAPRHPAALTLLAREHGFAIDDVQAIHPFPEGTRLAIAGDDPPPLQRVVRAINERVFGPQDLRMILRRE
ncbi:MAG: putative methyltransferase [Acidobacteria bacterium]|nr:putative methyltransferase [Acidobacteriota bacterium]